MELLADTAALEHRPGDELRVLQVHLVLLVIAVVRELRIAGHGQFPGLIACVDDLERPDFIALIKRHIVHSFTVDPAVICHDICVAGPVTALASVF